jgi:hypothetical protein
MSFFIQNNIDFIFCSHGSRNVDFRKGEKIGERDHVINLVKPKKPDWLSQEVYDSLASAILIRETNLLISSEKLKNERVVVCTSFIDKEYVSKEELGWFYKNRWHVELDFRNIKSTLGMSHISAKTPEMVHKTIYAAAIFYNLIRKQIIQAAYMENTLPREISFKGALMVFLEFGRITPKSLNEAFSIHLEMLKLIGKKRVNNRPGRREPRAIKRRPKPFPRLQGKRNSLGIKYESQYYSVN